MYCIFAFIAQAQYMQINETANYLYIYIYK